MNISPLLVLLATAACSKPVPCRFQVGQHVKILTGDRYVVMEAHEGSGPVEPRYKLMQSGRAWNLSLGGSGVTLASVYWAKESEIAGVDEEGGK